MKIFKKINFKVLLAALALGILATWASAVGQGSGERTITITYNPNGDPNHPDTGPFIFSPYELVIEHGASNVPIRLEIFSEGFSFPRDANQAITFHPNDGNFKILGIGRNNKRIMLLDFNRVQQDYKYDVVIINNATGQEYSIDPRINNSGGGGN